MLNELMNEARLVFENTDWLENAYNGYTAKIFADGEIIFKHRYIAENALGKQLPNGSEVHHYNGNKFDNRNFNLVVCPDEEYHQLLHERAKLVFETDNLSELYAAIKKTNWEHRHRETHPHWVYFTVRQRKAREARKELERKPWYWL